ncbi:efflux RND transporter periplasmic adaptor subunit [Bradymonas sediminis]|uniref:Uncharacterized protein n=1 Tax=Bradymonas sediminis TaxID=1548548 RepID=A0A2Z4FKK1_9DELT|nr:efflux RND transporter periplasmic adaptor subunit [Bradymonas sediminis]AWV89517.1 hypothetical protein DN745_09255 [Bradymonas sediminis]TDP76754.1 cobalt-zinc-cadmium efflux system membrane fusion protein [Bradymonas sediminis]
MNISTMTYKFLFIFGALTLAACSPSSAKNDHGHDDHADEAHADDEHPETNVVKLTPAALKRSDIQTRPPTAGALKEQLRVPAQVDFDPNRVAHISTFVQGQIVDIGPNIGDPVKANEKLATVRSVTLGQARAGLSTARAQFEVAENNYERQKLLRAEGINSERSLAEAQAELHEARAARDAAQSKLTVLGDAGKSGSRLTLRSPIDGVVHERPAIRGESVAPGDDLFVIADTSRVWILGQVYEQQVANLKVGMRAGLTLAAYPGKRWEGQLDYIAGALDPKTRTLTVRVELDNPDGQLRPGLLGTLWLAANPADADADAETPPTSLHIPRDAVQELHGRSVVFVARGEPGEFHAEPVALGRESGGQVEVLDGLAPDASVVVQGAFILKSELMRGELGDGHAH